MFLLYTIGPYLRVFVRSTLNIIGDEGLIGAIYQNSGSQSNVSDMSVHLILFQNQT